jgi:hypothetical protein
MEKNLSYLEKIENKERIISNLLINNIKLNDCEIKIAEIKSEEENFEMEINNVEDIEKWENECSEPMKILQKEFEKYYKNKTELEKIINNLKEELIVMGIPVPQNEGYEIINGLLDMKRDIKLKLVFYLVDDDNKIRQVFYFYYLI